MSEHDHDPSKRSAALSAAISLAVEEAADDSGWSYRSGFDRSDVEKRAQEQSGISVPTRTAHRALKDAAALGWVRDERQGWDAGERAEEYQPTPDENPI